MTCYWANLTGLELLFTHLCGKWLHMLWLTRVNPAAPLMPNFLAPMSAAIANKTSNHVDAPASPLLDFVNIARVGSCMDITVFWGFFGGLPSSSICAEIKLLIYNLLIPCVTRIVAEKLEKCRAEVSSIKLKRSEYWCPLFRILVAVFRISVPSTQTIGASMYTWIGAQCKNGRLKSDRNVELYVGGIKLTRCVPSILRGDYTQCPVYSAWTRQGPVTALITAIMWHLCRNHNLSELLSYFAPSPLRVSLYDCCY